MPTLLQINVDANNGSNGSIARDIGTQALSHGWKSFIAYGRKHIACDSELIKIGNYFEILLHGIVTRLFDMHGLGSVIATRRFIKKIEYIQPDIIHLHNIHGYFINYKILFEYLIKKNIPIVWTFHDCWPFTGHCGLFELYGCTRWKSICHHCPAIHKYPSSLYLDRSKHNFLLKKKLFTSPKTIYITTVSKWLSNLVNESYFGKYPIRIIYNGIDMECFRPVKSNLRQFYGITDKFVIISAAANWSSSKGWNDYIKLSEIIPKDYVIMLVGVTMKQKKLLPNNIIGVKRVEGRDKLAEYYSMADVLLNLSYQETFGMTTVEAMACGTPGISYNKTACPELLSPETGIVVEAGNIKQILSAIDEIARNGKDYYSAVCRQRVLDNFDSKKVNSHFFEIYNEILNLSK